MGIRVKEKSSCFISEQVRILRLETLLYSRPLSRGSKCISLDFSSLGDVRRRFRSVAEKEL